MRKLLVLGFMSLVLFSCKSDSDDPATLPGTVNLVFKNTVGNTDLILESQSYENNSGQTYRVNELKYIISNIAFITDDGQSYVVPQDESYFVINQADNGSKTISLPQIDGRTYTKIRFGFGVDQSNYPLNGVNNFIPTAEETDMLWSWSAGYKFIKFEGTYDANPEKDLPFVIHVGSHGTTLDNYKLIELDLANAVSVNDNTVNIGINFDIARIFDSPANTFSLTDKDDVQVDPVYAPIIAENVATAFSPE